MDWTLVDERISLERCGRLYHHDPDASARSRRPMIACRLAVGVVQIVDFLLG
jgi:hypothetical protein